MRYTYRLKIYLCDIRDPLYYHSAWQQQKVQKLIILDRDMIYYKFMNYYKQ